jgi:hypothetical protein
MKRSWLPTWNWATLAAWALVLATVWLVRETIHDSQIQLRGSLHQGFTKRFDELSAQRQQLAAALLAGKAPSRKSYESVMNFFEDLGLYLRRDYLDEEMVWNTFGYHASGWWSACEAQISKERAADKDPEEYRDFEQLLARLKKFELTSRRHHVSPELHEFLSDEASP